MLHRCKRAQYQQVSAFEQGRMIGLQEAGLSYRDIAVRTGHAAMTVMRVWNQWREESRMQRWAGTGPCNVTTTRDDRHLVRMDVTDCSASSTVLSRRWSTATGLDLSASTVCRCLLRTGLVAHMPMCWLPLSRDHQWLRLQWARELHHWRTEWWNVVFPDESRFNMSYNDDRIRIWCYAGECNLRACIFQRHRGPTPNIVVWGAIGYNIRSCLLHIEGNLNSNRYIREVLQFEVLPLLQATPHAIFQKDNAQPHVVRIVQAFFQRRRVSLLPWPARSPDMSPIEHVWDMVGRWFIHQGPPAPTLDTLWTCIQTVWRDIPQEDIQGLFDSMPRRIETLIAAHGGFTPYWNHMLTDHVQFCNSNRLSIAMYLTLVYISFLSYISLLLQFSQTVSLV